MLQSKYTMDKLKLEKIKSMYRLEQFHKNMFIGIIFLLCFICFQIIIILLLIWLNVYR